MGHSQVSTVSQEDSKRGPQLPAHDQGTADACWGVFCRKDGDGRALRTHSEPEQETTGEEFVPMLGECRADDGKETEDGGNKNSPTTSQIEVQGVRDPAAEEGRADIRTGVDKTEEQGIVVAGARDAKERRHGQIGSVGTGLIPALDRRTNRAGEDGEIQRHGLAPLVEDLVPEHLDLGVGEGKFARDVFVVGGVLGHQSTLLDQREVVGEVLLETELLDIAKEHVARDTGERVLDPGMRSATGAGEGGVCHVTPPRSRVGASGIPAGGREREAPSRQSSVAGKGLTGDGRRGLARDGLRLTLLAGWNSD